MNQKDFMERDSLNNNLKDYSIIRACNEYRNSENNNNEDGKNKLKEWWIDPGQSHGENYLSKKGNKEDYVGGFSWSPRSYPCSFCKREFRSAQALGGHMNVHRRDRAVLRQSPPNPNPNHSSASFSYTLSPLLRASVSAPSSSHFASSGERNKRYVVDPQESSTSLKCSDLTEMGTRKSLLENGEFEALTEKDGCKLLKNAAIVTLDSEIGLFRDSKEDLDLELRLGYS